MRTPTFLLGLTMTMMAIPTSDLPDEKVGKATFKLHTVGGRVQMEPLLVPTFELEPLDGGDAPIPEGISKCEVYARFVTDVKGTNIVLTVLKCGGRKYAVRKVTFQGEN